VSNLSNHDVQRIIRQWEKPVVEIAWYFRDNPSTSISAISSIKKQENILHSNGQEENASQSMKEKTHMGQAYQGLNPGEFTFE